MFVGPQIRYFLANKDFKVTMNEIELEASHAFRDACKGFLKMHSGEPNQMLYVSEGTLLSFSSVLFPTEYRRCI